MRRSVLLVAMRKSASWFDQPLYSVSIDDRELHKAGLVETCGQERYEQVQSRPGKLRVALNVMAPEFLQRSRIMEHLQGSSVGS